MADPIRRISPNPPKRRVSWEVRQVVDILRELVQVGEILTYEMVHDLCGIDLTKRRHLIKSIQTFAREEYDIVLWVLPTVGYERLSEPRKLAKNEANFQRMHNLGTRIAAEIATVDVMHLTPLEKHRYLAQQTLAACTTLWTDPRTRRALPQSNETPALPVPFDYEAHKDLFTRKGHEILNDATT